jgi:Fe-Mn family superoxide dismutase
MKDMQVELPDLPYEYEALDPVISKDLLQLHHKKHHQGYVNKANKVMGELEVARKEGRFIDMKFSLRDLSFNLNGHLLHSLFWECMREPKDANSPAKELDSHIAEYFDSFDRFKQEFSNAAAAVEGSGWMSLVRDGQKNLFLMQVENHNKLHIAGFVPVLVLDVWEHAYYLDYANDRGDFIESWWDVVNWDYVEKMIG